MRPQPSIEVVLGRAAESLERAAAETPDQLLATMVLDPVAKLLRRIAADFNTYVADRLAEIDRLVALGTAAAELAAADDKMRLSRLLDDARKASGRTPATQLDDLADALHHELLAVQESIGSAADDRSQELAAGIWAEQKRDVLGIQ